MSHNFEFYLIFMTESQLQFLLYNYDLVSHKYDFKIIIMT